MKIDFIKGLIAAAAVATLPMTASALTITGEATLGFVSNEDGDNVAIAGGAPNPVNLSLGPAPAEFNVQIDVADSCDPLAILAVCEAGFTATQKFTNNSGADLVISSATLLTLGDFVGPVLEYSLDDTTYTKVADIQNIGGLGIIGATGFTVSDGAMFWMRASAIDVVSAGDFDFNISAVPVPVPAGVLLMGTALAGFGVMRRKAKKKAA